MTDRPNPRSVSLPQLAHSIARYRRSSIVLLELTCTDGAIFAEDCSALNETHGRHALALAVVVALREMLVHAERELATEDARRQRKPD